jgi:hypothetical protein
MDYSEKLWLEKSITLKTNKEELINVIGLVDFNDCINKAIQETKESIYNELVSREQLNAAQQSRKNWLKNVIMQAELGE